jgi:DNA-binding GntR family transcriptional regulator
MMDLSASLSKIEKPQSLDDRAYLRIKKAILDCTLPPGAPLIETRLAEDLGVSRTPIRKAIARLEQEGFVTAAPSKGYHVAEISLQDIREIYQLREILECHLVRETARQFTQEELDEIESALRAANQALEDGDYPGFLAANRPFHHAFDRKYGNQRISDVLANLDEHVYRNLMSEFRVQESEALTLSSSYGDHRLILETIREGNVESAVSLMRDHLRRGLDLATSRLGVFIENKEE